MQAWAARLPVLVDHWQRGLPVWVWVWLARLAWAGLAIFVVLLFAVQWAFMSRGADFQPDIERELSQAMGQTVRIGQLKTHWRGVRPGVVLDDVTLVDAAGRPSFSLKQVSAFLSWRSLARRELVLDLLVIDGPVLHVRRETSGQIKIAGLSTEGETNPAALEWLLAQRQIRIQHADVVWEDLLRKAPPLALREVNIALDNAGNTHRLAVTALPPKSLASKIDLRTAWQGDWREPSQGWLPAETRLYAELRSADLAAWQPWLDYPIGLPQGHGGLRLWLAATDDHAEGFQLTLDAAVANLKLQLKEPWPRELQVKHWEGRVSGNLGARAENRQSGQVKFTAQQLALNWPSVFPDATQAFEQFAGTVRWKPAGTAWRVDLSALEFANADVAGLVQGSIEQPEQGLPILDLQGTVSRANAAAVWRYLPGVVGEEARVWLRHGLKGGRGDEGRFVLKGDLAKFPFHNEQDGLFRVSAQIREGRLRYADGWPEISGIEGRIEFDQLAMRLQVSKAFTADVPLSQVSVEIPDLETYDEVVNIKGQAQGEAGAFLTFVNTSPVSGYIQQATADMKAKGDARVQLDLHLPIRRLVDTKVQGTVHIQGAEISPVSALPPVEGVSGRIQFSEKGVHIPILQGQWLGQPARFQGGGEGGLHFVASGVMTPKAWLADPTLPTGLKPLVTKLQGATPWKADIRVPKGSSSLTWQVNSDLQGLSSSLPGPLQKPATRKAAFNLTAKSAGPGREQWLMRADKMATGVLLWSTQGPQRSLLRGGFNVSVLGAEPRLPASGLSLAVRTPVFRLEDWLALLPASTPLPETASNVPLKADASGFDLQFLQLEAERFSAFGRQLDKVSMTGRLVGEGWRMDVTAPDAEGGIYWQPAGRGLIRADLKRLRLRDETLDVSPTQMANKPQSAALTEQKTLPALDVRVADLQIGDRHWGRLEMLAENVGHVWTLPQLKLINPEGTLSGDLVWESGGLTGAQGPTVNKTQFNFKLSTDDAGRLLGRLGYEGLVKQGAGQLSGKLQWADRPTKIDYASLKGNLRVDVRSGQFAKIESGNAGKLIGLLSLQALPRRFLLDFKDVFSEGFAFDRIEGDLVVQSGVLRTREPLRVEGAAALVLMEGETDLQRETQQLNVTIRPGLGNVASLGAAVAVNPIVGLGAMVAQKILQNPLDRVFSYQYKVTGTWDNPEVSKD